MQIFLIIINVVLVIVIVIVISKTFRSYGICRCALPQLYSALFHCCYESACTSTITWIICLYSERRKRNFLLSSQFKILVRAKSFFCSSQMFLGYSMCFPYYTLEFQQLDCSYLHFIFFVHISPAQTGVRKAKVFLIASYLCNEGVWLKCIVETSNFV
jgi:hypothetical protein